MPRKRPPGPGPSHGETHYKSKLTAADVELIRAAGDERARLLAEARKLSNAELGKKFDVSKNCIDRVICYQTRKRG